MVDMDFILYFSNRRWLVYFIYLKEEGGQNKR